MNRLYGLLGSLTVSTLLTTQPADQITTGPESPKIRYARRTSPLRA
jgi:hypothetical protein